MSYSRLEAAIMRLIDASRGDWHPILTQGLSWTCGNNPEHRILVTGATGFLGSACVRTLAAAGCCTHALARSARGDAPLGITFHAADLFDFSGVTGCIARVRPTHLLHLAWIATPGTYQTSPENRRWLDASRHLLWAFAEHGGRRAVLAGSCAEYDWTGDGICHELGTPVRPATLYGMCKDELRRWGEAFAAERGVGFAWARLFFLFGPGEHPNRLIASVTRGLLASRAVDCSSGVQKRDFLHVSDTAEALVRILFSDAGGPINVGSGEPVAVKDVVTTLANIIGRPDLLRLGARPTAPGEPPLLVADVGRLRDEVGWRPAAGLTQRLHETVAWWRECQG